MGWSLSIPMFTIDIKFPFYALKVVERALKGLGLALASGPAALVPGAILAALGYLPLAYSAAGCLLPDEGRLTEGR
jgi:hypothetical protein